MLTRRAFFQSLAASVVAAGMPLPMGFPESAQSKLQREMAYWLHRYPQFIAVVDGQFYGTWKTP